MSGWTEHRFVSFDGTPIFYRRALPAGRPKAVVLAVHGMGEHGGRYGHVSEYLSGMGFAVFVPDLRGFGKSGGRRGCVRDFADFQKDLAALRAIAQREAKDAPFFLLGHSFGGLLSSIAASESVPPPAGLVLSSPIFGIKIPVAPWRHVLGLLASVVAPDYVQPTKVESAMLTHDPEILAEYARDPLIHHVISARLYRGLVKAMGRKKEIASSISCPTLVLLSGQDVVVDAAKAREFYALLRSSDKELGVYENLYHEILNETSRDQILFRIGTWISEHLS